MNVTCQCSAQIILFMHIEINLQDNGIGRKASAKIKSKKSINRKSMGIDIIKDRLSNFVKNLNNEYSIKYIDLPQGTQVTLKIPLD